MPKRVFITVADASGDQHAAELIRALRRLDQTVEIEAFGGAKMTEAGAKLLEETVGQAAMGWRGALRILEARRWMKRLEKRYRQQKPDLHICIDSSAINLPFAKRAKQFGVPVLYYVAPQLWASREGRIKQVRAYVDRIACIFPFEEAFYRDRGVNATFVGHPLFDEMPTDRTPPKGLRFPDVPPTIGIIPGSRKSEVSANLPHMVEVMNAIVSQFPDVEFLIPTTAASHAMVTKMLAGRADTSVQQDGFDHLIPRCDLVVTKSGTSTVHVAAWRIPMLVVYRINPILWHLAGRWLVKTKKIAMVNILAGQIDLVPEFVPWYGSNQPVIGCALNLLQNPQKLRDQRMKLDELMSRIDQPGASRTVAQLAFEMLHEA